MRSPTTLSLFARREPLRTTACGRCGDSFAGSAVAGRTWLAAHAAAEHPPLRHASKVVEAPARSALRPAALLRESLS